MTETTVTVWREEARKVVETLGLETDKPLSITTKVRFKKTSVEGRIKVEISIDLGR